MHLGGYKPIRSHDDWRTEGCWFAASSHITNTCCEIQLVSASPECIDKKKNSLIHKQRAVWASRCNQGLLLVLQVLVQVQVQAPVQEQGSSPPPQALPSNCWPVQPRPLWCPPHPGKSRGSVVHLPLSPSLVLTLTVGAGLSEELLMLPFSHMFLMLRVPPVGISATVDLGDFTSLFPCGQKKNNDDNFKGCWKVAFQRKTLSDRSPGRLMRTGPFCCRSWRRWGCGTIWAWCCIEEETCDISAMMHKCPVHLSKLITHLFWADLFKNSAFSPICTKKKKNQGTQEPVHNMSDQFWSSCSWPASKMTSPMGRSGHPQGRLPGLQWTGGSGCWRASNYTNSSRRIVPLTQMPSA